MNRRERSRAGGGEVIISSEDSTRFYRKVSEGALTNRFSISGKQILEAVEEAVGGCWNYLDSGGVN